MLARRGMVLVPDNVELSVKNAKTRDDLLQLKSSSSVAVKERAAAQKAGGPVRVNMSNMDEVNDLGSYESLMCSSLTVTLPHSFYATDLFNLLEYCFPFATTLTLELHPKGEDTYQAPLQLSLIERLLRFNNFPALTQIRVVSSA